MNTDTRRFSLLYVVLLLEAGRNSEAMAFNMTIMDETDAYDSIARPYWISDIRNCFYSFGECDYFERILNRVFLLRFFI